MIAPNVALASGQNLYTLGSYTMPFAGFLSMDLFAELNTPGGVSAPQNYLSVYSGSTPGPSVTGDMGVGQTGAGIFSSVKTSRTFAYWNSVSQGTVVTVIARVYSTQNAVTTVKRIGGFFRASAR